jgi:hypothetical protein
MIAHTQRSFLGAAVHALFVGAAVALFLFILCWAGEATGFYPPAANLIELFNSAAEFRQGDAFLRGAASAAVLGAVVGALIAMCSEGLNRLTKRRG